MTYCFSPSSLSVLKSCPRCFWLQFNKNVKRPAGIFPSLPNGIDRVLKAHFDSFIGKGLLPPEIRHLGSEVRLFENRKLLEEWRNYRKGLKWRDGEGNTLSGAVDTLLERRGKIIVLDYKTKGSRPGEDHKEYYRDQLDLYNFLLRKNGFETEDFSYLLFYSPDRVEEDGGFVFGTDLITVDVSMKNAEGILEGALEVLGGKIPEANKNCEYCKFTEERKDKPAGSLKIF